MFDLGELSHLPWKSHWSTFKSGRLSFTQLPNGFFIRKSMFILSLDKAYRSFTCEKTISDADLGRCLTADGLYLYTTNSVGRGVSKLGSGLHGTLRSVAWNLLNDLAGTFPSLHKSLWTALEVHPDSLTPRTVVKWRTDLISYKWFQASLTATSSSLVLLMHLVLCWLQCLLALRSLCLAGNSSRVRLFKYVCMYVCISDFSQSPNRHFSS